MNTEFTPQGENKQETITIEGENVTSGQINVNQDPLDSDLNAPSISDLIKSGSTGFFEYVIEFEEEHPWIFFGGIALILFLIIGGIMSLFVKTDTASDNFDLFSYLKEKSTIISNWGDSEQQKKEDIVPIINVKGASTGLRSGLILSNKDSYDSIVYQSQDSVFLAYEFGFIQQMKSALQTDIQGELIKIDESGRLAYLREFLVYLIDLEKKGAENYLKLSTLAKNFEAEKNFYNSKKKEAFNKTNASFENGGINQLSLDMKEMSEYENKYDEVDNKLILTKQIYAAYREPLKLIQARIAAIRANKDILLLGVKVFSIYDAGLNLIEQGKVQDWYESKAPITERINYSGKYSPTSSKTMIQQNSLGEGFDNENSSIIIPNIVSEDAINSVMNRK